MREYNNNGEPETVSGEVTVPEVAPDAAIPRELAIDIAKGAVAAANNDMKTLAEHRNDVMKMIQKQFGSAIMRIVDTRKYDTKVTCTEGKEPMSICVNIETNDPRVIAALATSGEKQ